MRTTKTGLLTTAQKYKEDEERCVRRSRQKVFAAVWIDPLKLAKVPCKAL